MVHCVLLWCTVCYYGVLCVAMVYCVLLWYTLCCYGVLCVAMVYCVLLWYTVCCYGILCVAMVYCVLLWYTECCFFSSGLNLQAMDTANVCLVHMDLSHEGFEPYRCDKNIVLGINLTE